MNQLGVGDEHVVEIREAAAFQPSIRANHTAYFPIKRAMDTVLAGLLLIVLSLPLLIIAIAVRLDSPGPIIYSQWRAGKDGRPFRFHKFRSMYHNSPEDLHREYVQRLIRENLNPADVKEGKRGTLKLANDPRVTRVGRLLRHYSLDELPQLANVIKGEMSLVGPRPSLPYEVEVYQPWHRQRLAILPGCTGLWQVTARNLVAFDDMVRLDLEYMESMSPWLDLKLMLLTPWVMLKGRGAG